MKKKKGGIVYSTNPDYEFDNPFAKLANDYSDKGSQVIRIWLDRKKGGKVITRITGFDLKKDDLDALKKKLQNQCGTGGTAKDQEILIQGDHRNKIQEILIVEGFKPKLAGG